MSYDLTLFKKIEDKSIQESAEIIFSENFGMLSDKDFEKQKHDIQNEIKKIEAEFICEENNDVSMTLALERKGIEISVYRNQIGLSMPYWDVNEDEETYEDFFLYAFTIKKITGYIIYDNQNDQELVTEEIKQATESHKKVLEHHKQIIKSYHVEKNNPILSLLKKYPSLIVWGIGLIFVFIGTLIHLKFLTIIGIIIAIIGGRVLPGILK
jgi:hypothetical protein